MRIARPAVVAPLAFLLLACPSAAAEEPAAGLTLCLGVAADFSPVYPVTEVPSTNREVVAAFRLGAGEAFTTLTSRWIAVDVGDAAPKDTEVGTADLPLGKKRVGVVRFTLPRDLPLGAYRVEVAADGKPWKATEFRVVAPREVPAVEAEKVVPLEAGRTSTYDTTVQVWKGITFKLPGFEGDPKGVSRGTSTQAVRAKDEKGTRIESRAGQGPVGEEWWTLGESGLALVASRDGGETVALEPPRPMLPLPLERLRSWTYTRSDGAAVEGRAWGPVPLKAPGGEAHGWVVLESEPLAIAGRAAVKTTERHFVPGVGLVRRVDVTAVDGEPVIRFDNVLRETKPK